MTKIIIGQVVIQFRVFVQVGSVTNTFNVPGVEENCFFLKDMEGAKALRQRINECFEISALPSTSPEERRRLLTFVVVSLHGVPGNARICIHS